MPRSSTTLWREPVAEVRGDGQQKNKNGMRGTVARRESYCSDARSWGIQSQYMLLLRCQRKTVPARL